MVRSLALSRRLRFLLFFATRLVFSISAFRIFIPSSLSFLSAVPVLVACFFGEKQSPSAAFDAL